MMAKMIRWKGKHMGNLKFALDQQVRAVDTRINRVLQDLESEMVPFMQNIVNTTPSGIVSGKDNRVWSGDMLDALGSEFKNRVTLNLGWVKEQEEYFAEQDQGTGTRTGGWGNVPPMHLLEKSKIEAEQYMITELRRYFK